MANFDKNYGIAALNDAPCGDTATIAVTGLGRSGTTMLSRTLLALDLPMGDNLTPQSAEDKKIQLLIKERVFDGFRALCRTRDASDPIWAFKCPALRGSLVSSVSMMRNPRVILVFRDILAISQRNAMSVDAHLPKAIEQAAQDYVKLVRQARKLSVPVLLVSYEKALQYPQMLVQSIGTFCGLAVCDERARKIAAFTIVNADPRYTGTTG